MKKTIKKLVGPAMIILILGIVITKGIQSGSLVGAAAVLASANPWFLAACVLCFVGYIFFDALSTRSALKSQGYVIPMKEALRIAITGQFYSNVTPGATGGQPMQVTELHRQGVPVGVGTSALITHFIAVQIMLSVLMTVFGIPNFHFLTAQVGSAMPVFVIGYIYNLVMVAFVCLLCFTRNPVLWGIDKIVRIAEKLHLTKDTEALRSKLTETADTFHDAMTQMRQHKKEIIKQLILGGLQQLCWMSMIVFVFHALRLTGAGVGALLTMAFAQHISAGYAPMPGASGAQEGVFGLYFGSLFTGNSCYAGMMLWRFMTYYLALLVGAAVTLFPRRAEIKENVLAKREELVQRIAAAKVELKTTGEVRASELRQRIAGMEKELLKYDCGLPAHSVAMIRSTM